MGLTMFETGLSVFSLTLTSPTIQGTVDAGTGLTMPAFTAGSITIGANKLIMTDSMLYQYSTNTLAVRKRDNSLYHHFACNNFHADGSITGSLYTFKANAGSFSAYNAANNYFILQARDTGAAALQEVMRIGGGAIPFMSMPADTQLGLFGATPVSQQVHVADPTDLDTCISAITAINAMCAAFGLTAAS